MPSPATACDGPSGRWTNASSDVAEDQRVVILTGLVANKPRIGAARRSELVLSNIGDPGCQAEEESLNGNDVNCIDPRCRHSHQQPSAGILTGEVRY